MIILKPKPIESNYPSQSTASHNKNKLPMNQPELEGQENACEQVAIGLSFTSDLITE